MRRKEPAALRVEWPEQFHLDAIRIAEQQIGAPFRAEPGYVHKGEARAHGEIHVAALRTVHFERRLEHGGCIIFLDDLNQQAGLPVLLDEPVACGIVAAHSGQPRQDFVQFFRFERLALEALYVASDVGGLVRVRSFNLDELRHGNVAAFERSAYPLMLLPIRIVESKRFQQTRARTGGFIAELHDLRALGVIHGVKLRERNGYDGVRLRQAAQFAFFQHDVEGLIQHGEGRLDILSLGRRGFEMHGDHDFRAHLTNDVGGQIVQQAAIHENGLSVMHRGKSSGNGHGCAQRNG